MIQFSFYPGTLLSTTLPIMLKGMLGIFAVIIVIWIMVAILNKATAKKTKK